MYQWFFFDQPKYGLVANQSLSHQGLFTSPSDEHIFKIFNP